MGYLLSRKAEDDIISIYLYGLEKFGQRQADIYHDGLSRTFELLAQNPLAAAERTEIIPPVRIYPFGAHIVVYRLQDDGNIFVIRVRHEREDW